MNGSSHMDVVRQEQSGKSISPFHRSRLYSILDENHNVPVKWISGPGGSGKTILTAAYLELRKKDAIWYNLNLEILDPSTFFHFLKKAVEKKIRSKKNTLPILTPEHMAGLSSYALNFFETLFANLPKPVVLVFDNYQNLPENSPVNELMALAFSIVPEGIEIYIISRNSPPESLARLRTNQKLLYLGWEKIRFSEEESRDFLVSYKKNILSEKSINDICKMADGWAAGLVILLESKLNDRDALNVDDSVSSIKSGPLIFDYFASEVFNKIDVKTKKFLLITNFLKSVDAKTAKSLTGRKDASKILEEMAKAHYFTSRSGRGYEYHSLFKNFLSIQAAEYFAEDEIKSIKINAAKLLQDMGDVEEAMSLYLEAEEYAGLTGLVLKQAPQLLSSGRFSVVEHWVRSLPDEITSASSELLHWLGISLMPFRPVESMVYLQKAFALYLKEKNAAGVYSSWGDIIQTGINLHTEKNPIDYWLDKLNELIVQFPEFPSPDIEARVTSSMVWALAYSHPDHPDLPQYCKKLQVIVDKNTAPATRLLQAGFLLLGYVMLGEIIKAGVIVDLMLAEKKRDMNSPLTVQLWSVAWLSYMIVHGDENKWNEMVKNEEAFFGNRDVNVLGINIHGNLLWGSVFYNRMADAKRHLEQMLQQNSSRLFDNGLINFSASMYYSAENQIEKALDYSKAGLSYIEESGYPWGATLHYVQLALLYHKNGEQQKREKYLQLACETGNEIRTGKTLLLMTKARIAFDMNQDEKGLAILKEGIAVAKKTGMNNWTFWDSESMAELCVRALDAGIETGYVRDVISKAGLKPPHNKPVSKNWPWKIKILTLGKFEIYLGDELYKAKGKSPLKPLELLKTIIFLGGNNVSETEIMDILWPDAEGDHANWSFRTTLKRLREMLQYENAIQTTDKGVTLNTGLCYVDRFELERWLKMLEPVAGNQNAVTEESIALLAESLEGIEGVFLPNDHFPGLKRSREKLENRISRCILQAAAAENSNQKKQALLEKGISLCPMSEEIVRSLMICLRDNDCYADAARLYLGFRDTLETDLGISPSPKTVKIYDSLAK